MNDRRKLKRRQLIYYLRVLDSETGELLGHTVDISPEGIMLMSEQKLEIGKLYHLTMTLPTELYGKENLNFDAVSVRSCPDINNSFFDTGFQFLSISDENLQILVALITFYKSPE